MFAYCRHLLSMADLSISQAESALTSAVSLISQQIGAIRQSTFGTEGRATSRVAPSVTTLAANESPVDIAKRIQQQMSKDGLAPGVSDLTQMANSIAPIIDKFDATLVRLFTSCNQHTPLTYSAETTIPERVQCHREYRPRRRP